MEDLLIIWIIQEEYLLNNLRIIILSKTKNNKLTIKTISFKMQLNNISFYNLIYSEPYNKKISFMEIKLAPLITFLNKKFKISFNSVELF